MTPIRLRECLDTLGWSQRGLAEVLNLHETRVRRWARASLPIPQNVAEWLEKLSTAHVNYPLPEGWDREPNKSAAIVVRVYDNGIEQPREAVECHSATESLDAMLDRQERFPGPRFAVGISVRGSCSDADRSELKRQSQAEGFHLEHIG